MSMVMVVLAVRFKNWRGCGLEWSGKGNRTVCTIENRVIGSSRMEDRWKMEASSSVSPFAIVLFCAGVSFRSRAKKAPSISILFWLCSKLNGERGPWRREHKERTRTSTENRVAKGTKLKTHDSSRRWVVAAVLIPYGTVVTT